MFLHVRCSCVRCFCNIREDCKCLRHRADEVTHRCSSSRRFGVIRSAFSRTPLRLSGSSHVHQATLKVKSAPNIIWGKCELRLFVFSDVLFGSSLLDAFLLDLALFPAGNPPELLGESDRDGGSPRLTTSFWPGGRDQNSWPATYRGGKRGPGGRYLPRMSLSPPEAKRLLSA